MIAFKGKSQRRVAILAGVCTVVGLAVRLGGGRAAGEEPAKKAHGKQQVVESKAEKRVRAACEDFAGALGVNWESLKTFGARVDAARAAMDPVALALLAKELATAEEISKKQAGIKADNLLKEAVDLAKARNQADELKAVALLSSSDPMKKELSAQAEGAERETAQRKAGEVKRGIERYLVVNNKTAYNVVIYVNGSARGVCPAYDIRKEYVGASPIYATRLVGISTGGTATWGPRLIDWRVGDYLWNLSSD